MITKSELEEILIQAVKPVSDLLKTGKNIIRARLNARKALEDCLWKLRTVRTLSDYKIVMRMDGQRDRLKVVVLTWDSAENLLVSELTFTA